MKTKFNAFLIIAMLLISIFPQAINAETNINIGDYIQLGTYKNKPIIWRYVGEDSNGKLMYANQIICYKSFDAAEPNNNNRSRKNGGSNLWSESNIRCWLNSDNEQVDYICGNSPTVENVWNGVNSYEKEAGFLTNFTADEKKAIKTVTLKTPLNSLDVKLSDGTFKTITFDSQLNKTENNSNYQNTTDRIFLLDCEQLNMVISNFDDGFYGGSSKDTAENEHIDGSNMTEQYFLRTPNEDGEWSPDRVLNVAVNPQNDVLPFDAYAVAYMSMGIRPAFYLNDGIEIKSGKGTQAEPYILSTDNAAATTIPTISLSEKQDKLEVYNGDEIKLKMNGIYINFPDAQPFIDENNRTQVPVRAIAESAGLNVSWDEETQTVSLYSDILECNFVIGMPTATVKRSNGEDGSYEYSVINMDTDAIIVTDRTYIPVTYLAEAMSMTSEWNEDTQTVSIRPIEESDLPEYFPNDVSMPAESFAVGYTENEVPANLAEVLSNDNIVYGEGVSLDTEENYSNSINVSDNLYKQNFNFVANNDEAETSDIMTETPIFDQCNNLVVKVEIDCEPVWLTVSLSKIDENGKITYAQRKWHAYAIDKDVTINFDNLDSNAKYFVQVDYAYTYTPEIKNVNGVITVGAY
jgi:hypothetical protein